MALPYYQTQIKELSLLETQWASQLNPIIANPLTNPSILKGVALTAGANVINHKLGATQQGWIVSDINAAVTLYRSQPFNNLTLTLVSSGNATADLVVF